ncbi:MAG: penicillin acylase family protein [Mycobacteriales bacterium]
MRAGQGLTRCANQLTSPHPRSSHRCTDGLTSSKVDAADMRRIQLDLRSTQAELFLDVLRPLLPDTPDGRAIGEWNLEYDVESLGAEAFERFYAELFQIVFGRVLGSPTVGFLADETGLFTDFYASFDRVLLAEHSSWFGTQTRQQLFEQAAARALTGTPRPWGEKRKVVQQHLMLGGKLPLVFGFDRGPLTLAGGRATPHQGQIYRSGGRLTTFSPSYRMVTDFAESGWESCLAVGDEELAGGTLQTSDSVLSGQGQKLKPDGRLVEHLSLSRPSNYPARTMVNGSGMSS